MLAQLAWERNGSPLAITIAREPVVVGKAGDVKGDAAQLAAQHCRIAFDGKQFVVEHLDGVPTRVNGRVIDAPCPLKDGDEIQCAELKVRFLQKRRGVTPPPPPPPPPRPKVAESDATLARLQHEVAVLRQQLDTAGSDHTSRAQELDRLRAQLAAAQVEVSTLSERLSARDAELVARASRVEVLASTVEEREGRLRGEVARAESSEEEAVRLRAKLEQRDADLREATTGLASARTALEAARRELETSGVQGEARDKLLAERDAELARRNGELDDAEHRYRKELARGDTLHRDKDRIDARAAELLQDNLAVRRDLDKARLQLEASAAKVGEAQLERDRAQQNLAKLTNVLADCQSKLNDALIHDDAVTREIEQLRALVDAQQDELRVISEARQRVQGLYEDLQRRHASMDVSAELLRADNTKLANENARCRVELDRQRVELERVIRERIPVGVDQDAALALEDLRNQLAEAQTTIIRLRSDTEVFQKLRTTLEGFAEPGEPRSP